MRLSVKPAPLARPEGGSLLRCNPQATLQQQVGHVLGHYYLLDDKFLFLQ